MTIIQAAKKAVKSYKIGNFTPMHKLLDSLEPLQKDPIELELLLQAAGLSPQKAMIAVEDWQCAELHTEQYG